jgi:two-component system sensor histidine kinase UhpB
MLLARELERMRGVIHQLRPALEDAGGLYAALTDLAEETAKEAGIDVHLELDASEEWLDLAASTAVLRVTQEAMRNVRKHAAARSVTICTRVVGRDEQEPPEAWILEVRDDGRGLLAETSADRRPRRHFGIRFMRERAALVGGRLEIGDGPAGGTTVRLTLDPRDRSQA